METNTKLEPNVSTVVEAIKPSDLVWSFAYTTDRPTDHWMTFHRDREVRAALLGLHPWTVRFHLHDFPLTIS